MPDTPRTLAALQALFADNITGDISAQALRDFLVSALEEYGEIYVHDGAVAQAGVIGPVLMTGFATNGVSGGAVVPDVANDRITIGTAGRYLVIGQFSTSGSAGTNWQFHARLDGVEQPAAATANRTTGATPLSSCCFAAVLDVTAGQQLTVYVESDSGGGASFTIVHGQLSVKRVQ
jgi:hypothetical protein